MIVRTYCKPYVPKFAPYDYLPVYNSNGVRIGWIKIWQSNIKPF